MDILVINSGSSSLKFELFCSNSLKSKCKGIVENISKEKGKSSLIIDDKTIKRDGSYKDHKEAFLELRSLLLDSSMLKDFSTLKAIGHRVVHGGELFCEPTLIDSSVVSLIESISHLAPLHNPANLVGIKESIALAPKTPQVAVFDTSFHQSIEDSSYIYALPYEWYEKYKVRRYGFHGSSHKYLLKRCAQVLDKELKNLNIITLHLGNGSSACAIKAGKSIDTSMGLTPLEGLVMGSRCGDIDSAIIGYIHSQTNFTFKEIDNILNKESGLKGVCGDNDLREILKRVESNDSRAILAFDMLVLSIKKYIGSYSVLLGRVDAIVFTGGIGENSAYLRERVCEGLEESIGLSIDREKNSEVLEGSIDAKSSKIKLLVLKTNEELEIAESSLAVALNISKI